MRRSCFSVILVALVCGSAFGQNDRVLEIYKVAGAEINPPLGSPRFSEDYVPATETVFCSAWRLAAERNGGLLVADSCNQRLRRVAPEGGEITPVAGGGWAFDGPALMVERRPDAVAVGPDGSIYLLGSAGVDRIDRDGLLYNVWNRTGFDIEVAGDGTIYVAAGSAVVRRRPNGEVRTVAGRLADIPASTPGPTEPMFGAFGLGLGPDGSLYVAESQRHLVHRLDPAGGGLQTVAGRRDEPGRDGDGGPATAARIDTPMDVAADSTGALYIGCTGAVRRVALDGAISTVVGGGTGLPSRWWGDGGQGNRAVVGDPWGVAVGPDDEVYFGDRSTGVIRRLGTDGVVTLYAGSRGYGGDGGQAVWALLESPAQIAFGPDGSLYIADTGNHAVRRVAPDGVITTVAGGNGSGYSGDGGPAADARLSGPEGVAVGPLGEVYVSDTVNHRVRVIRLDGRIETLAGDGAPGFSGEGRPAAQARLATPRGLAVDSFGRLLIADSDNHRIRRIEQNGTLRTLVGNGQVGTAGDGGMAVDAQLIIPRQILLDAEQRLILIDPPSQRIRRVDADNRIRTIAGGGPRGASGELPATQSHLSFPSAAALGPSGRLYIVDDLLLRRLDVDGVLRNIELRNALRPAERPLTGRVLALATGPGGVLHVADGQHVFRQTGDEAAPPRLPPTIAFEGVRHAASLKAGAIAPGALVSVFGRGLGPAAGLTATPEDGRFPRELGAVRVLFDGIPGSVLFARDDQVNAMAPFGVSERTRVQIEYDGVLSNAITVPAIAEAPAAFLFSSGLPAALNHGQGVHGEGNPARPGSILTLFATGAGEWTPPIEAGVVTGDDLSRTGAPVSAFVNGIPATVLYAGTAPGLISGVLQVNLFVPAVQPDARGRARLTVQIGNAPMQAGLEIAFRP